MNPSAPYPDPVVDTAEISDWNQLPADPLVSVYMLTYNHYPYIAQAIEGVIAQKCGFPIELIIGEDCSTDRTDEIVRRYQRGYPWLIRILTSTRNVGWYKNSTRCKSACRGKYIAICEGDDYWHNDQKLALQVDALTSNPLSHLVHTDYDRRIGDRVVRNAHKQMATPYLAQGDAFIDLLHKMTVMTATAMYTREIILRAQETNVASPSWPFGDYPNALFSALHGPVLYLPISTATYRKVQGSAMNQSRLKQLRFQQAILDCRETFMRMANLPQEARLTIRVQSHQIIKDLALRMGDTELYKKEIAWFKSNNVPYGSVKNAASLLLLRFPFALKVYRVLFKLKWQIKLAWRYRSHASSQRTAAISK